MRCSSLGRPVELIPRPRRDRRPRFRCAAASRGCPAAGSRCGTRRCGIRAAWRRPPARAAPASLNRAPARTIIVKTDTRTIYREPARDSGSLARLEPGVVAKLLECRNAWCRIETQPQGIRGWLLRSEIWGVYPDEVVE